MRSASIQSILEATPQLRYVVLRAKSSSYPSSFRHFSSTSSVLVRRPMEKYPMEKPIIDDWGNPVTVKKAVPIETGEERALNKLWDMDEPEPIEVQKPSRRDMTNDGLEERRRELLRNLAETRRPSWTEKYGAHDGFGLQNKRRYAHGPDGELVQWDAAGEKWRDATGYHSHVRVRSSPIFPRLPGSAPTRQSKVPLDMFRGRPGSAWHRANIDRALGNQPFQEVTPNIEHPLDAIKLNLDAWDREYRAAADAGIFVKRQDAKAIRKRFKALARRQWEDAQSKGREQAVDTEQMSPWEEDEEITVENVEEISALPPSERAKLDPRASDMMKSSTTAETPRNSWAASPTTSISDELDRQSEELAPPPQARTIPHESRGPSPAPRQLPAFDIQERRTGSRTFGLRSFSTLPTVSAFMATVALPSSVGFRQYHSKQDLKEGEWIEDTALKRRPPPRDPRVFESRRAKLEAYQQQVAATFVPNRRRNYDELAESPVGEKPKEKRPWIPTKKLTFSAMEGLRALHKADPATFTPQALSEKFGISREATHRILRSNWREKKLAAKRSMTDTSLQGTKWAKKPSTATVIDRVYAQRAETLAQPEQDPEQ
ncbi:hypothetical protein BD324DRAFT_613888 [Kockovaella imperatae]|uniref:Required for respiratory growth protein 9, mitochondrial n=1 Tax=Kockovaella imperatae TaxID=4999 RepID=A0A1Y1UTC3_9TREE|nr:hypothetical protein BD324DRAFT_613888 [Kockovaella imperatae]ORX41270.1 hypothetical protein BD324DRAFT_613888 [Kockovaella imperatae]